MRNPNGCYIEEDSVLEEEDLPIEVDTQRRRSGRPVNRNKKVIFLDRKEEKAYRKKFK